VIVLLLFVKWLHKGTGALVTHDLWVERKLIRVLCQLHNVMLLIDLAVKVILSLLVQLLPDWFPCRPVAR
jgi:hypothetical protein